VATKQRNTVETGQISRQEGLNPTADLGVKTMFNVLDSSRLLIPCAADIGNHMTKVKCGTSLKLMESCYTEIVNASEFPDIDDLDKNSAFVRYLNGDNEKLIGVNWVAGKAARDVSPNRYQRIVNSSRSKGKVDLGLQFLLAAIPAPQNGSDRVDLVVCASLPDATILGDKLTNALVGEHLIEKNGDRFTVVIDKVKTFAEGVGAYWYARHAGKIAGALPVTSLDIGGGTIITQQIDTGGKVVQSSRNVIEFGVNELAKLIAKDDEFRQEADVYLILEALLKGEAEKHYGTMGFEFSRIFKRQLKVWKDAFIAPALSNLTEYNDSSEAMLIIGGGSIYIGASSDTRIINLKEVAQTAHVQGMALIASRIAHNIGGVK
jgi:hypothetical protein